MEMKEFIRTALRKVSRKLEAGTLDRNEEGYSFEEEKLLDWIWIELKEEAPDKDAVIQMELDDLYEIIESDAKLYDEYQILLESLKPAEE
ncbi:hypothetical protein SAMN02746041_00213 [Desulfacinum hydrothermale DSM 13146]|uniref:Uncharacterized protein n=1 Tax=Desulfacinum hydrothermale DSM 13146 TaxID=1121390 RepID=A0A1W1WZ36_9BACT|nr:hypothetical protein [Desulfacinum hydrothermale]SMC16996.1 hypothetical protein SAMN02746041_00213 [Desulfacinum hydrothermale DSM 13146]